MKIRYLLFACLIITLTSCGPSKEKREEANTVYKGVLSVVDSVNRKDSNYVACLHYLMREIQSQDLKKNKKKTKIVKDSIALLDSHVNILLTVISSAEKNIAEMKGNSHNFELLQSAEGFLSSYKEIVTKFYKDINKYFGEVSFPVRDSQYTHLLRLSYKADSSMNVAIQGFNTSCAEFSNEYSLKELEN